jgi:hypothetical protein
MRKLEEKKVKPAMLGFDQNRLLKQKLKKLFGYGLIENQKMASSVIVKSPSVVKFLQAEY